MIGRIEIEADDVGGFREYGRSSPSSRSTAGTTASTCSTQSIRRTLLAYGMNGRDLPVAYGAPLRLRVERQIGYKSMKYLTELIVTEHIDDGGDRGYPKNGWAWYNGI
jgi:DMSO/TMAO reductase YedYZ molybdopterin-dependent catalytic subunit